MIADDRRHYCDLRSAIIKTAIILNNSKAVSYCKVSSQETIGSETTTKISNLFGVALPEKNAEKFVNPKDKVFFSRKPGNIWRENKKNQKHMLLRHEKSCHDK